MRDVSGEQTARRKRIGEGDKGDDGERRRGWNCRVVPVVFHPAASWSQPGGLYCCWRSPPPCCGSDTGNTREWVSISIMTCWMWPRGDIRVHLFKFVGRKRKKVIRAHFGHKDLSQPFSNKWISADVKIGVLELLFFLQEIIFLCGFDSLNHRREIKQRCLCCLWLKKKKKSCLNVRNTPTFTILKDLDINRFLDLRKK